MQCNMAGWDRGARVVIGLVLLTLGWFSLVPGTLGLVFKVLGFVPLAIGVVGVCPAYSLFGFRSNRP